MFNRILLVVWRFLNLKFLKTIYKQFNFYSKWQKLLKKPIEIEFITFEDFVEYGKQNSTNIAENGMPWSFDYKGHPISHENDEAYVIPTLEGTLLFTPKEVLITGVKGEIYPCRIDIFESTYDIVK